MLKTTKLDHCEKIFYLSIVIKNICEENNLSKDVIIEDFIYLLKQKEEVKDA